MKKYAERLYAELTLHLKLCLQDEGCEQKQVEKCFLIATCYWKKLLVKLRHYVFHDTNEEVYFFKKIKPLFTMEIEYYNLLYFSKIFLPCNFTDDYLLFWQRERERKQKFIKAHTKFYDYHHSGSNAEDHIFYTRIGSQKKALDFNRIYEDGPLSSSLYDPLLAILMAIDQYQLIIDKNLMGQCPSSLR